jgi:hypothetical protein
MTATFSKLELSGSTDGKQIKIAATSSPGTAIHTATSSTTTGYDEVWLWAVNSDTVTRLLTVQWGGTTAPDDSIACQIPPTGALPVLIVPGLILQNSLLVKAFCATTNVVMLGGYVNRVA